MKDLHKSRKYVLIFAVLSVSAIICVRLFSLQLIDPRYKDLAHENVVEKVNLYPSRGLVYDRNNTLLVYNQPVYDIKVVPRQVKDIDTALACQILGISRETFEYKLDKCSQGLHYYTSNNFVYQLPAEQYALFQENAYLLKGFYGSPRTIRKYVHPSGALIFGDVGEVDSAQIVASDFFYKPGDYVGKSGIESYYEEELRGSRGYKYVMIDKFHNQKGAFDNGDLDSLPVPGKKLQLTIDIDLQAYGEYLLTNKVGSIVAIEPQSGEILALISSPSYDPNLLCGRDRGKHFNIIQQSPFSPMFNRPVMAQYPPGSTFKPIVGLVALQERVITKQYGYACNGIYRIPGYTLHCSHRHDPATNIMQAIQHSCNPYFWQIFRNTLDQSHFLSMQEAYERWHSYIQSFGLGNVLEIDIPGEKKGFLPKNTYYNQLYGEKGWKSATVLSLGIGQGELLLTPLQMANMYAAIANKGFFVQPHLAKSLEATLVSDYNRQVLDIDTAHFDAIIEGLEYVVEKGTAKSSKIPGISFCGKTGTAQNPHGEDHSIFCGFAPKEDPQIAIAVVVENAGGGATYAAPMSSLMVEKYLNDTIGSDRKHLEEFIVNTNLNLQDTTEE